MKHYETHVCRDCGAEIIIPFAVHRPNKDNNLRKALLRALDKTNADVGVYYSHELSQLVRNLREVLK